MRESRRNDETNSSFFICGLLKDLYTNTCTQICTRKGLYTSTRLIIHHAIICTHDGIDIHVKAAGTIMITIVSGEEELNKPWGSRKPTRQECNYMKANWPRLHLWRVA